MMAFSVVPILMSAPAAMYSQLSLTQLVAAVHSVAGGHNLIDSSRAKRLAASRAPQPPSLHADDPLAVSHDQCLTGARELAAFCRRLPVPYGFNVESVSIRRTEIEAAVDLAGRLRPLLS